MDNFCHTLVGAAVGEAGLKHRTRFGTATLLLASNLPDLDVLVFATSVPSIAFRRGWTHGVLALALLPVVLTAVVMAASRVAGGRPDRSPVRPLWLLLLAYVGVVSHVFLDFLNTYGVRLLAPFDWRWFYGDAVFIIDPWLWVALSAAAALSIRRRSTLPARVGLTVAAAYIAAMLVSGRIAREVVTDAWKARTGRDPVSMMVGPVPVTPLLRQIIVDAGDHYQTGTLTWWPTRVTFEPERVEKNHHEPPVAGARQRQPLQAFLIWSRFPYFEVRREPAGTRVSARDMRFANIPGLPRGFARGRGAATVVVPHGGD